MNLYSVALLCFAFGVLLIAILVMNKRKDVIGYRFLNFSFFVVVWGTLAAFWLSQSYSKEQTLFLVRLSHVFAAFVPITWVHFVFEFIQKKPPFRLFYKVFYIASVIVSALALTPHLINRVQSILDFEYFGKAGSLYFLFLGLFYFLVPFGTYYLYKAYKISIADRKEQLKYLIIGTVVGFSAAGTSMLALYSIPFPIYLYYLTPLYPILTGIALIKYGLFDVQEIADAFQREKVTALGIMAASLNHEMRNPLYIAKGKIEGYRDAVETARSSNPQEVINSVSTQLDRTLDIMQRFSDFARPQSMTKKEDVLFLEVFRDVSELISHEIQKRKIHIHADIPEGSRLRVHRRQFEEILVNLMINASQALEEGGKISIKVACANGKTAVEIFDNGPGIPEENQKRIFDPFFSTKNERGMGLGLYITKQLVEKNGGKISVESKRGKGTAFMLEFKL